MVAFNILLLGAKLCWRCKSSSFICVDTSRAGEMAVVVDKAVVTSEVFLLWKDFFVGCRVVGLREYSFRSSSPPAF
jgi:hypothetical protein